MSGQPVLFAFLYVVGTALLFLVFREVVCWYYKINTIVALLQETNELLRANAQVAATTTATQTANVARQVIEQLGLDDKDGSVDDPKALQAADRDAVQPSDFFDRL